MLQSLPLVAVQIPQFVCEKFRGERLGRERGSENAKVARLEVFQTQVHLTLV